MFRTIRIKDLGRVITGSTPSTKVPKNFGEGYPFIKPPDLSENTRGVLKTENEISAIGYETQPNKLVPALTTCVVCIGTIGKLGLTTRPSFTNQQINSIVVDRERHDPLFVYYLIRVAIPKVKQLNAGSASGRENVNKSSFENIEIQVPPLLIQRQIASILSAYDDLIENNLRRIKILEEMAQNLYREWFVQFRFPGHEQVRMVDSPLGKIPERWEVVHLLDVADVQYGFAFKSKLFTEVRRGMPVIRIRDIPGGETETFTEEKADNRYIVENGDILVGMDGDFHMTLWSGGKSYQNQRVAKFQSKGSFGNYHLFLSLVNPIRFFNSTITGTTVAHLGHKHIKTIQLVAPDSKTLEFARKQLEPLAEMQINLKLRNQFLRQTRDLLLPKLISGELDVSNLEISIGQPEEAAAA